MIRVELSGYRLATFGTVAEAESFIRDAVRNADEQADRGEYVMVNGPDTEYAPGGHCGCAPHIWDDWRREWSMGDAAGRWKVVNSQPELIHANGPWYDAVV